MKQDFQKELKDKIKEGIKPSTLKKLKKSKSVDDITPTDELDRIKKESETKSLTISLLRKKNEELQTQLNRNPPTPLLTNQLQEKQQEVENLREQLETTHQKLTATTAKLDHSLLARIEALKQFDKVFTKLNQISQQLEQNVNESATELINQDQIISELRKDNSQLKLTTQSLTKDLHLAHRITRLKDYPSNTPQTDYLRYGFYLIIVLGLMIWILNYKKE